ncbi:MAG: glycosyltransferase family 4 protein [bacterium]
MYSKSSPQKIAYIVSLFPKLSETFIVNELRELMKIGTQIEIFSLSKRKEKIVHKDAMPLVSHVHYPHNNFSGLLRRIIMVAYKPLLSLHIIFTVIVHNIIYKGRPLKAFYTVMHAFEFAFLIRCRKIHHIHAHFFTSPSLAAWVICRLTGISFSATGHAHDIFCPMPLVKRIFLDMKFLVTISEYNRQYLVKHYGSIVEKKIVVIHCGIRIDIFHPQARGTEVHKDTWHLLSIGRLVDYKGFPVLIKACTILKDHNMKFHCRIIGSGPDFAQLNKMIHKANLQEVISLLGDQKQTKIRELLMDTDIFILASQRGSDGQQDGIPVVLMEALAMGIPSISTKISGIPELIRDGENGLLVDPQSPEMLAEAIEMLIHDTALRQRFHCMGPLTIDIDYNSKSNTARLNRLFWS